jgi:hypothetical protein
MTTGDAAQDVRRGWTPWLAGAVVLPVVGAAAVVALVNEADLAAWADWQAGAAVAAAFAVPALLSSFAARRHGWIEATAWALACLGIELALVFGVGFLALDLLPD